MSWTTIPSAGAKLRASVLSSLINELRPLEAKKPSDQSIVSPGSTTLVNDSALFVSVAANTLYDLSLRLIINTNATANFKYQFSAPAGSTSSAHLFTGNATTAAGVLQGPADAIASTSAVVGIAADQVVLVQGWVLTGGSAGTLTLKWAQNVLNASTTSVKTGSTIRLDQVL